MNIIKTPIEGLLLLQTNIFNDERGYFFESWSEKAFKNIGLDIDFVQDNESSSKKGVLRGLHFQAPPFSQGKLVRVIKGKVLDIAVDIRKQSKTYGKYFSIELSGSDNNLFWIPPGFAHGFLSLEDDTIFCYKCTSGYNKDSEGCLLWNDEDINIDWHFKNPIVSDKDQSGMSFSNFNTPFSNEL
jgi:dTDP-4-dehydrorhamnose 3,5-epimerase